MQAQRGYESIDLRPSESMPDLSEISEPKPQLRSDDNMSMNSDSPLQPNPGGFVYPSMTTGKHIQIQDFGQRPMEGYDPERGRSATTLPGSGRSTPGGGRGGHMPRNSSWDILAGIRNDYEEFDTRKASEAHLSFAQGDIPDNKVSRFYHFLLSASIITRWTLFIVPVMALLWIPGIVGLTAAPKATVWGVKLLWWSAWMSVAWGGWWACLALARMMPTFLRYSIGIVAVGSRRYIDWFNVLDRYVALLGWTLAIWATFQPLVDNKQDSSTSDGNKKVTDLIAKGLFALFLCAAILTAEKFSIQWIAGKFHEKSYAERIAAQKFSVRTLTVLYRNSRDIPGRSDTMRNADGKRSMSVNPKDFFKKALKGVRFAATTTTTALGNVASEIAGSSVLQPNSPQAMVQTALRSPNKTRLLARRLFYSFIQPKSESMIVSDISHYFSDRDAAYAAFQLFDKDNNGDATRDEVEMACMEVHREQLSIENSMRDLDSAVGRLDNILMTLYFFVCVILIAVVLDTELVTLLTGAGTLVLGLSWLIGSSLADVLTSIIFLFIKHPYDVGDRVDLGEDSYTVKEIRLLSTVFLDSNGALVQAPNTVINGKFIVNVRRSPQMSETFTFDVAYDTTFEQLEDLREKMLAYLQRERRDFQPSFDVFVVDIPEQEKMTLKADIKYKSNWQMGAIKAKRRNKWICALKAELAHAGIFGPSGDPNAAAGPTKYTLVPWEEVKKEEHEDGTGKRRSMPGRTPTDGWELTDKNALVDDSQDIFGEADERYMTNPRRDASVPSAGSSGLGMPSVMTMPSPRAPKIPPPEEVIEMKTPRAARNPDWPTS